MRIGLFQINPAVGDIAGNIALIRSKLSYAKKKQVDVAVFPELSLTGCPPLDLVFEKEFLHHQLRALKELAAATTITSIIGFVEEKEGKRYNAAAVLEAGKIKHIIRKTHLSAYQFYDERKYFSPGEPTVVSLHDVPVGIQICDDLWDSECVTKTSSLQRDHGARVVINISASPFFTGKNAERMKIIKQKSSYNEMPILYLNMFGASDELIFDGRSIIADKNGNIIAMGNAFEEDTLILDYEPERKSLQMITEHDVYLSAKDEEIFEALVLGIKDYFAKSGFKKAVVGLSGGIDSSLTVSLAAEALGKQNVIGVSLPSPITSQESVADARQLAKNLGIKFFIIPLEKQLAATKDSYAKSFGKMKNESTFENLQARERAKMLMAIANDNHALLLATSNKTEIALGYTTLYGDMCGSLLVIGDVDKQQVYSLARHFNAVKKKDIIIRSIFEKKPSAELKKGQTDPFDYAITVPITNYIMEGLDVNDIVAKGYKKPDVVSHYNLMRKSEFKRRQLPPVLIITRHPYTPLGKRYPLVNRYVASV